MRVALLLAVTMLWRTALAGDLAFASPGKQWCSIDWAPGQVRRLDIDLRVKRRQLVSLDGWGQVAPGGRWLAVRTETSELHVFSAKGAEVWRRAGVSAFRFSPSGDQLAVSSPRGIEVVSPARPEPRQLGSVRRADWLGWVDGALLVRTDRRLLQVDDAGHERSIATLPKDALLTSSPKRAVFFSHGAMTDLDLAKGRLGPARKLPVADRVVNGDLAPDGSRVLFATDKGTYLIEGQSITKLADGAALSLAFSPDGAAYLWVGPTTGSLVSKGKEIALPDDTIGARFRQDGGADLVLTVRQGGIITWNPVSGLRESIGGIAPDDGANFSGDVAGGSAIAFFCKKSAGVKEHSIPSADEELFQ